MLFLLLIHLHPYAHRPNNKIANNNTCRWEIIWSEVFQLNIAQCRQRSYSNPPMDLGGCGVFVYLPDGTAMCRFMSSDISMCRFMPGGIMICRPAYQGAGRSMRWIFKWDTPRQMGHKSGHDGQKGATTPFPSSRWCLLFLVETLYVINLRRGKSCFVCRRHSLSCSILRNWTRLSRDKRDGRWEPSRCRIPSLCNGNTNEYIDIYLFICI